MSGIRMIRAYSTKAGSISSTLLLSRNPIITADVPKFERQFYLYQKELWKRLMWTFPKWFYFREGTLAEQRFRELNKNPVSNDPLVEFPEGRPEIRHNRDRRFKQELRLPKTYKEADQLDGNEEASAKNDSQGGMTEDDLARKIEPYSRTTEADKKNDQTSLERRLARTLYLVVKNNGKWHFPSFQVEGRQTALHDVAEQGLYNLGGNKINYFNVSNTPCHLHVGANGKEYFIKSHILSGDFAPTNGTEFKWLSKDELKEKIEIYEEIEHLLSDV